MANVKKRKHFKRWRNGFRAYYYGMYWCRVLIWKFIMGNPSNFEGGNNEGIPLNTLGQVYHGVQLCRYY
jgi:biopolymer transport protein ExbB